jgi:hypothetical protein
MLKVKADAFALGKTKYFLFLPEERMKRQEMIKTLNILRPKKATWRKLILANFSAKYNLFFRLQVL